MPFQQVALDATGARLALANQAGPTFIVDLADPAGEPVIIAAGVDSDIAFSPDGSLIAIGTGEAIEIFDAATGEVAADAVAFAGGIFHFTGARKLQAFDTNQGVVEIDLDAESRIVESIELDNWSGIAFLAPDLSTIVGTNPALGLFELRTDPLDPDRSQQTPLGPLGPTTYHRPLRDGGYISIDTVELTYTETRGGQIVQQIDLTGAVTPGGEHVIAPRIGRSRDIVILADEGEVILGSEVAVIDRERGEVVFSLREPNIQVAEFANSTENRLIVGYTDGTARWVDIDGEANASTVQVDAAVGAIAATQDGSLVAIGDWSGTLTVLDQNQAVVAQLVNDAAFPIRLMTSDTKRREPPLDCRDLRVSEGGLELTSPTAHLTTSCGSQRL